MTTVAGLVDYRHVTAAVAIALVHHQTGTTLTVGQIRVWCTRGHIARRGTDAHGFALYDLEQILARARSGHVPCQP